MGKNVPFVLMNVLIKKVQLKFKIMKVILYKSTRKPQFSRMFSDLMDEILVWAIDIHKYPYYVIYIW